MVEWYLVVALLVGIASLIFLLYVLRWLPKSNEKILRLESSLYFELYIKPRYERGLQAGIPLNELVLMAKQAIDSSSEQGVMGLAPTSMLEEMVDQWIADNKNEQGVPCP